jgi:lipoate-protein ligase B
VVYFEQKLNRADAFIMIARSYLMASLLGTILLPVSEAVGVSLHRKNFVNIIKYDDYHLPYSSAWDLQLDLMQHHLSKQQIDSVPTTDIDEEMCVGTVVICQHSPTYTLGSATTEGSGPFSKKLPDGTFLEYETFTVERAGQATFHGPGQLVVYPILDLGYFSKDIHLYLRVLEQTIMDALTSFDITSQRIEGTHYLTILYYVILNILTVR